MNTRFWPHLPLMLAALLTAPLAAAGSPDYDSVADKIVNQSLNVMPGEIIAINGGPTELALMGALQVAVAKAGGEPVLLLNLPEANKRAVMETPMEHLSRLPASQLMMTRMIDGFINVGAIEDPELFSDVPEERLSALRKAAYPLNDTQRTAKIRSVSLGQTGGIPTESYAKSRGADFGKMTEMFWKSVAVDPEQIAAAARVANDTLRPGAKVRLMSDAGTDMTFTIANTEPRINAGRTADVVQASGPASVWLPAGEAYACIDGATANGTLAVPSMTFRGLQVSNLRMRFDNGRMTSMSADKNQDVLKAFFAESSADTAVPSIVDVGLNTASQPLGESDYLSWEMGGMITIGLGNNGWAGGDNNAEAGFTTHLRDTSLIIEGEKLVDAGKLSAEVRAAYRHD